MASSPFKPFPPANIIIHRADVSRRQKAHLDRMDKILRHSSLQELWSNDFKKHKEYQRMRSNQVRESECFAQRTNLANRGNGYDRLNRRRNSDESYDGTGDSMTSGEDGHHPCTSNPEKSEKKLDVSNKNRVAPMNAWKNPDTKSHQGHVDPKNSPKKSVVSNRKNVDQQNSGKKKDVSKQSSSGDPDNFGKGLNVSNQENIDPVKHGEMSNISNRGNANHLNSEGEAVVSTQEDVEQKNSEQDKGGSSVEPDKNPDMKGESDRANPDEESHGSGGGEDASIHKQNPKGPPWKEQVSELLYSKGRSRWKDLAEGIKIGSKNINGIEKNEAAGNPYLQVFNTFFVESHEVDAREATYLILEKLHEMDRDDACDIIRTSIAESQTPSSTPLESIPEVANLTTDSPYPAVFISYQWDSQKEVVSLYHCLTELGFNCWIDIEQLKAGDKLYKKLNEGVANCKVMISCITAKYLKSKNCRKEITVANGKNKPIIPLKFEKTDFSSCGEISFILSELVYFECIKERKQNWRDPNDTSKFAPKQLQEKLCEVLQLEIKKSLSQTEKSDKRKKKKANDTNKGPADINQNPEESTQESREAMQLQMIHEQQKIAEEVIELIQAMAKQMEDGQEKSDQRFDELQKQITEINEWRAQQCCSKMCTIS